MDKGAFTIKGLENVKIYIGSIATVKEGEGETQELEGITPKPSVEDLRDWDMRLLERYKPTYSPMSETCTFCTYGPCDLSDGKEGACGLTLKAQQARLLLFTTLMGASAHATHGRHMLDHFFEKFGRDVPIEVGNSVDKTPNISLVTGTCPETIGDLDDTLTLFEQVDSIFSEEGINIPEPVQDRDEVIAELSSKISELCASAPQHVKEKIDVASLTEKLDTIA